MFCFWSFRKASASLSANRNRQRTEAELIVALTETDPANVMEAGLIFPEPGQEEQWFDQNRAKLTQLGWTAVSSDSR